MTIIQTIRTWWRGWRERTRVLSYTHDAHATVCCWMGDEVLIVSKIRSPEEEVMARLLGELQHVREETQFPHNSSLVVGPIKFEAGFKFVVPVPDAFSEGDAVRVRVARALSE